MSVSGSNGKRISIHRIGGSFLTASMLVVFLALAGISLILNSKIMCGMDGDISAIDNYLKESVEAAVLSSQKYLPLDKTPSSQGAALLQNNDSKISPTKGGNGGIVNSHLNRIAGLNCDRYGGPSAEDAQEMVYWEDIPSDAEWISPFHSKHTNGPTQYLTFEPDHAGWNNRRMALETTIGIAFAMGRTLVLPPRQQIDHLKKDEKGDHNAFSFADFFHLERIHEEHVGLDIISMQEFLEIAMQGTFVNAETGIPTFPPGNRTNWDFSEKEANEDDSEESYDHDEELEKLYKWLRNNVTNTVMNWNPEYCLAAFPRSADPKDLEELQQMEKSMVEAGELPTSFKNYIGNPVPVDGSPRDRLRENSAERDRLCIYDKSLQDARWLHFQTNDDVENSEDESRLLVHFYAFLFFQDWKHDLWMKRFIRDHVRYGDEIQCAAARVVKAIRKRAMDRGVNDFFDSMHVRRGDFSHFFAATQSSAREINDMLSRQIPQNTTLYIATDEKKRSFFEPIADRYDIVFLSDFQEELGGVNKNYYGMIDQLIASRGRVFYGCWFTTFTGYINRLRGYHADDHQTTGYEDGIIPSYYYALKQHFFHMQRYYPVKRSFFAREFPTAWRLIDTSVE